MYDPSNAAEVLRSSKTGALSCSPHVSLQENSSEGVTYVERHLSAIMTANQRSISMQRFACW